LAPTTPPGTINPTSATHSLPFELDVHSSDFVLENHQDQDQEHLHSMSGLQYVLSIFGRRKKNCQKKKSFGFANSPLFYFCSIFSNDSVLSVANFLVEELGPNYTHSLAGVDDVVSFFFPPLPFIQFLNAFVDPCCLRLGT
jgi:hypothetical protein